MTRTELESINIPVGWLCPMCGTIYSPGTSSCNKCGIEEDKTYAEAPTDATYEIVKNPTNQPYDS